MSLLIMPSLHPFLFYQDFDLGSFEGMQGCKYILTAHETGISRKNTGRHSFLNIPKSILFLAVRIPITERVLRVSK